MKRAILTRGLPGSGKSTWAKQLLADNPGQWKRVNKDSIRDMADDGRWSKGNETFVQAMRDRFIVDALTAGYHVVVDDTNLAPKHHDHIAQLVKGMATVEVKDFTDVPVEECIKRDLARAHSVGETVIRRMYNQFLRPAPPVVVRDPTLPDAILCDLDGTLALFGDANPYDRDFMRDDLNVPVQATLAAFKRQGHAVLLASGRKDSARQQTEAWLDRHDVVYDHLWMRQTDDNRKDAIVKREIYEAQIRGVYNVLFVLDDRDQVVELWRSLGLTCFQVEYGDF